MRRAILVAALLAAAGVANAAADPAALRAAGDWRLSEVGGKVACTLTFTLTHQPSFAGFELKAPLACRRAFPALKSVAAWTVDGKGAIVLSDARAQPIVSFPAQARGPIETKAPNGRTWRLDPVKPGTPGDGATPAAPETPPPES
ncbi:MAG: AprI/Inh family metalloprotease inhibitor [Caulobacteraceae bacterium]